MADLKRRDSKICIRMFNDAVRTSGITDKKFVELTSTQITDLQKKIAEYIDENIQGDARNKYNQSFEYKRGYKVWKGRFLKNKRAVLESVATFNSFAFYASKGRLQTWDEYRSNLNEILKEERRQLLLKTLKFSLIALVVIGLSYLGATQWKIKNSQNQTVEKKEQKLIPESGVIKGRVFNTKGQAQVSVKLQYNSKTFYSDSTGYYEIEIIDAVIDEKYQIELIDNRYERKVWNLAVGESDKNLQVIPIRK